MKFSKSILFGIFSVLLMIFFIIYRKDNLLQILAAFFTLCWFVQLPGSLLLVLFERKVENYLRILLFGNVIGLAIVPLLYYALYFFNLQNSFELVISCLVVILCMLLILKVNKKQILFSPPGFFRLNDIFLLLFIVMIICSFREFSQMLSWNFMFNSKRDTDSGTLMSMVIGLKNFGYLVNMNYGSAPINYHHFIYLVMALIMKTSHIGILPLYQVVFPLYSFFLMTLAAYYFAITLKVSQKTAVLCAVSLLLLDDFYFLNQGIKFFTGNQPVYSIESIEWLHNGPSTVISLLMIFVVLAELSLSEKQKIKNTTLVFLIIVIGALACYKISTWACLVGGMAAASVFKFGKNRKLALLTMLSIIAGLVVNKFLSGFSRENYASDGMQLNIGYPLFRFGPVKSLMDVQGDILSFHDLNFKIIVLLILMTSLYLLSIFGVRLFYVFRLMKEGFRKLSYTDAVILFAAIGGIIIAFFVTPKVGGHNVLYFVLTGMYLLSVVSVPVIVEFVTGHKNIFIRAGVIILVAVQLTSGMLQVMRPVISPVKSASLSPGWFEAMEYLKDNTDPNSLLAYNRFQLKENYYKNDFDFIPVFSERAVIIGGKQYYPGYEFLKLKTDTLFSSSSPEEVKRITAEMKIDYIVFDKWKGGNLLCNDTTIIHPVFTNEQVNVYRVNKN